MITFSQLGKMGRLGNQIFQLSCCVSYAINNGHKYEFPPWEYQQYFNLINCYSDKINPTIIYTEPSFCYTEIPLFTQNEIVDFRGYMQSYKYFNNNQDIIQGLFTPRDCPEIQWNCTSIHVRRGDYLKLSDFHTNLNLSYYFEAIKIIRSKKYIIFSDDINWCKYNFKGEQFIFSNNNLIEDLKLMSKCEHNIIANSSFSWWGAFLNKNPSKTVIAPKQWFGPNLNHNTKDLLPSEWIKIDA